jgi:hypothetical protein
MSTSRYIPYPRRRRGRAVVVVVVAVRPIAQRPTTPGCWSPAVSQSIRLHYCRAGCRDRPAAARLAFHHAIKGIRTQRASLASTSTTAADLPGWGCAVGLRGVVVSIHSSPAAPAGPSTLLFGWELAVAGSLQAYVRVRPIIHATAPSWPTSTAACGLALPYLLHVSPDPHHWRRRINGRRTRPRRSDRRVRVMDRSPSWNASQNINMES